jgi:hypothetical protein
MYRGSQKHVLDWIDLPGFAEELLKLVQPVRCVPTGETIWQPLGNRDPREPQLDQFGPRAFPGNPAWPNIMNWWLKHTRGAKTPNWDIALRADVEGRPGLILVEAKANAPELKSEGKALGQNPSDHSRENHEQIGRAIAAARAALDPRVPGISISRDTCYQLSNRLAFAWRLASLGIPTVLVYLGFVGAMGIADVGAPFEDEGDWQRVVRAHLAEVNAMPVLDGSVDCGTARFWVLIRSRRAVEDSPPRPRRSPEGTPTCNSGNFTLGENLKESR